MIFKLIIYVLLHHLLNIFLVKKRILLDKLETSSHKTKVLTNVNTPLSGGLMFVILFLFITLKQDYFLIGAVFLIYILGLLSDVNLLSSPSKRILFQTLILVGYITLGNIEIRSISIDTFDQILKINLFNSLFLLLCLLVLINGSNFLDGLNGLVINYFIICFSAIYISSNIYNFQLDFLFVENILLILIIISIFNLFGKSFLGDSGSYSLAFFMGVFCIQFIYDNPKVVSPYFVALLLWYPAIENLFSIIRRINSKKNLSVADNFHLHHLIYNFLKNKNIFDNKILINSFSSILINLFNLLTIFLSIFYVSNTKVLISIIFFNIFSYFLIYFLLKNSNPDKL